MLNAVSHRDYQLAGSIFVRQYRDRLVIESPGGFPTGITVDNILDRQSPRNSHIVKIFQLCGLVERSGQGMNLIFELAIKEAKSLPDFNGSDAYFIKLTLNGQILDKRMLTLIKKIGDERLEAMTTDDYILLRELFHRSEFTEIHQSRFEHLAELGIIKQTDRGLEIVNGDLTFMTDALPIDWQSIGTDDRKKMIAAFIKSNPQTTSTQIAELTKLSQMRVRAILQELVTEFGFFMFHRVI